MSTVSNTGNESSCLFGFKEGHNVIYKLNILKELVRDLVPSVHQKGFFLSKLKSPFLFPAISNANHLNLFRREFSLWSLQLSTHGF